MIEIQDLIGKEFKYFGRGPDYFDCWGLVVECSKRAGIFLPEYRTYIDTMLRSNYITVCKNHFEKLDSPEPYCVVTFKLHRNLITHCGFVLEDKKSFIHIMRKRKVSVEKLDSKVWQTTCDGYYKFIQ